MASQGKWENIQNFIKKLRKMIEDGKKIPRPRLELIRILLIYVARNYREFNLYLKRIHLT